MGWDKRPSEFIHEVQSGVATEVREMAAFALQQVITASPVDEGVYRANHRAAINGSPDLYDQQRTDGQAALRIGLGEIGQFKKLDGSLSIYNASPYAARIEHGHSQQAPEGVYAQADAALRSRYPK